MKCVRASDGFVVAGQVELAQSFITRLFGLMFRASLPEGHGLWLEPCRQIHMFFMRFAIDVIFLDKNGLVIYTAENFQPWRVSPMVWKARGALELPAGTLKGRISAGDTLELRSN